MGLFKILATSAAVLLLATQPVAAGASDRALQQRQDTGASSYWFSNIKRQGVATFAEADYKLFRNVKDYGAVGDGVHDDTDAINKAVTDGPGRCIEKCDSRTTHPAIVYFPHGIYLISKPIVQTYHTQFVGDATNHPTIKGTPNFDGMGMIEADPYDYNAPHPPNQPPPNWYKNQNNFFRQVRNFVIDMTDMPTSADKARSGIHWQVAQATSLQNIKFNMAQASSSNYQKGLYIENGSGGFMTDLTFNGGGIGADIGSQQYTTRNLTFNGCNTAIHMIWNWLWLMQGVTINGGQVGINMTGDSYEEIKVGSLLLLDSKISNVPVGIMTLYKANDKFTNNTLVLDNVDMSEGVPVAVQYAKDESTLLEGNKVIDGWVQGRDYSTGAGQAIQVAQSGITKPDVLLDGNGRVFTRTKPQYENVDVSHFVSVKSAGAAGDGKTDDTAAIQKIFDNVKEDSIIYFDHGAYLISDTIHVPKNIKITGEMWPLLMATGEKFTDESKPVAVFEVGKPGDVGNVEMSDLIIETKGALPGAILMQWNLAGSESGASGMWDVHFRVGGAAGTDLQSDHCSSTPNVPTLVDDKCKGAFLMLHLTKTASAYIENCWFWVADHELDREDHNQINIYSGRGVLIEAQNPVWLWGTASEHSVLYNYQISNAKNTFIGVAQTETAYMQGNPDATQGATVHEAWFDPNFAETCDGSSKTCARTWGLRITNSTDVYILGAGLYNFYDNYGQVCVDLQNCQDNMISIENSEAHLYGISTKASINMLIVDGKSVAQDKDNRNTYCAAIAKYEIRKSGNPGDDGLDPGSNSSSSGPTASPATSAYSPSGPSDSGTGSSLSQTPIPQPASPTGGYGQTGGDLAPTMPSVPPVTTVTVPPISQMSGGLGGTSPEVSESTPVPMVPTVVPTPESVTVGSQPLETTSAYPVGSQGPGGVVSGDEEPPKVYVTVTKTVTAPGTCQTS